MAVKWMCLCLFSVLSVCVREKESVPFQSMKTDPQTWPMRSQFAPKCVCTAQKLCAPLPHFNQMRRKIGKNIRHDVILFDNAITIRWVWWAVASATSTTKTVSLGLSSKSLSKFQGDEMNKQFFFSRTLWHCDFSYTRITSLYTRQTTNPPEQPAFLYREIIWAMEMTQFYFIITHFLLHLLLMRTLALSQSTISEFGLSHRHNRSARTFHSLSLSLFLAHGSYVWHNGIKECASPLFRCLDKTNAIFDFAFVAYLCMNALTLFGYYENDLNLPAENKHVR